MERATLITAELCFLYLLEDIEEFVQNKIDNEISNIVKNVLEDELLNILACHTSGCFINEEVFDSMISRVIETTKDFDETTVREMNTFRESIYLPIKDNYKRHSST